MKVTLHWRLASGQLFLDVLMFDGVGYRLSIQQLPSLENA